MTDPLRLLGAVLSAAIFAVALAVPAQAQHPTAVTSIVNSNADTTLEVNYSGGLLMPGKLGDITNYTAPNDSIPATGAGTRMMWYPEKAALRAGRVFDNSGSSGGFFDGSDFWNAPNVGKYSVAFGKNTRASGETAVAMGEGARALGQGATALGRLTTASEDGALAIGVNNGPSVGSLFVVGNGGEGFRSNALVLDQSGNLSIQGVFESGPAGATFAGHFQGEKTQLEENRSSHIALVENTGGPDADGLAIQTGQNTDPTNSDNFITFFDGDGDAVGAIQGNGSGGTERITTGSDYAEELPVAGETPTPKPKSIVGVRRGEVRLETKGADRLMVVSSAPALTGNTTPSTTADDDRRVAVAFVGQVPAKVRGDVEVGELIVASRQADGVGRSVSPTEYRREKHGPIAGQAWSAKSNPEVGEVTVAVGLGRSGAVAEQLTSQRQRIAELETENEEFEDRLAALEAERSPSAVAGLTGSTAGVLLAFVLGGLAGAGLLWRRRR